MANADRFEDLIVWQRARELTTAIYQITAAGRLAQDRGLSSQMQRAAVSVMANIAEGFEHTGAPEFQRFVTIAKLPVRKCARCSMLHWMSDILIRSPLPG